MFCTIYLFTNCRAIHYIALLPTTVGKGAFTRFPRLINVVESAKLNSTVERYCLHSSTKVNEAVDFKMAANELVRNGVVICEYLMKECQHILEERSKRKKRCSTRSTLGKRP